MVAAAVGDEPIRAERGGGGNGAPIAYLTGEYPKVSHTFIQREVAALRDRGLRVDTYTIRRPPADAVVGADQRAEAERTEVVLDTAKKPAALIAAHLRLFLSSPRRWIGGARLAAETSAPGARNGLWQLFYFLEAGVLAHRLRQTGARHLHNHFADSSCTVAMLASALSGVPFSFTLHGPAIFYEPRRWRLDEKIARADFVACISHFCRSQAMFFSDPSGWDKLRIVHCGVFPEEYGRSPGNTAGKNILFVGRLDAVKGVPLLLDAVAGVLDDHPDLQLTIVGDGADRSALEAQAARLGIDRVTEFVGYRPQDEVAEIMSGVDLLVLPSFAEGVPVTLMEAMASRIPVIASQVAGVTELVEDGVTGFVIAAGDVESLRHRITELLDDPEMRERMGAAGRAVVEREFDLRSEAAWLAAIMTGGAEAVPGALRPGPS